MTTGAIRWLQPGDLVWDYSSPPSIDRLLAAGVKGVSRYLSKVNDLTKPKILTYDELHRLADAGIAVMLNLEWNPFDPIRGAPRGQENATYVNQFRHESGWWGKPFDWPDDVPMFVSLDIGVTPAELDGAVTDYYAAFKDTYTGSVMADYHGVPLHRRLASLGLSSWHWTAGAAWSWSSPFGVADPPTHIVQYVSGVGGHNQLLAPVPFWDPNADPVEPLEDDMLADERQWLADLHEAVFSNDRPDAPDRLGLEWAIYNGYQNSKKAPTAADVAAAVVAALPPSQAGGPTLAAIEDSFKRILNSTRLAAPS